MIGAVVTKIRNAAGASATPAAPPIAAGRPGLHDAANEPKVARVGYEAYCR